MVDNKSIWCYNSGTVNKTELNMNAYDRDNLEFLRSLSEDALKNFLSQASEDDVQYAGELLAAWEQELNAEIFGFESDFHSATMH